MSTSVALAAQGGQGGFICLTGFIRRAEPVGFIQRGTHRLVDRFGNVIASLRSSQVNLFGLEGQFVTVCGINEGRIEGVTSLVVTQVLPANIPGTTPAPGTLDIRLLLLLLLLSRPDLFQSLLGTGLFGLGTLGLGTTGLGALGLGTTGLGGLGLGGLGGLGLGGLGTGTTSTGVL